MALVAPPVSRFRPTEFDTDRLTLAWQPAVERSPSPAAAVKSYRLERHDAAAEQWSPLALLPADVTRYTVPEVDTARDYRYRIITETYGGVSLPIEYEATRPAVQAGNGIGLRGM